MSTDRFYFEHKGTVKKSLSVKREWLDKVRSGAERRFKEPGLIVTFEGDQKPEEWVMVPMDVFKRLMDDASDAVQDGPKR